MVILIAVALHLADMKHNIVCIYYAMHALYTAYSYTSHALVCVHYRH